MTNSQGAREPGTPTMNRFAVFAGCESRRKTNLPILAVVMGVVKVFFGQRSDGLGDIS